MQDRERCAAAWVPKEVSMPELVRQILRQAQSDGVSRASILGDSVYGNNTGFRAGVRQLGIEFFLQVEGDALKGWNHEVRTEVKWVRRHVHPDAPRSQTLADLTRRTPPSEWKNAS